MMAFAPEGVGLPKYMEHKRAVSDKPRVNRTDEKKFVVALLKAAERQGVWLRRNFNGLLQTMDGVPVRVGLGAGTGDCVGYTVRVITPEMVGRHVAVWTEIECKLTDGGVVSDIQNARLQQVVADGGIAFVAYDQDGVDIVMERLTTEGS